MCVYFIDKDKGNVFVFEMIIRDAFQIILQFFRILDIPMRCVILTMLHHNNIQSNRK